MHVRPLFWLLVLASVWSCTGESPGGGPRGKDSDVRVGSDAGDVLEGTDIGEDDSGAVDNRDAGDGDNDAADDTDVLVPVDADTGQGDDADTGEDVEPDLLVDVDVDIDDVDAEPDTVPDVPDPDPIAGTSVLWSPETAIGGPDDNPSFWDYPFPESLRVADDSTIDVAGFPNPDTSNDGCADLIGGDNDQLALVTDLIPPGVFRDYLIEVNRQHVVGFGTNTSAYFRFDGPLSQSVPSPEQTLDPTTSEVFLVNVDPGSNRVGEVVPVQVTALPSGVHVPENLLSVLPFPGFSMAPGALHAAVVKRDLGDVDGELLGSPVAFERLKQDRTNTAQEQLYTATFAYLESLGIQRENIAAMTVFVTQNPLAALADIAPRVEAVADPATLASVTIDSVSDLRHGAFYRIEGRYNAIIYQRAGPPYLPKQAVVDLQDLAISLRPDAEDTDGGMLAGMDPPQDTSDIPTCNWDSGAECDVPRLFELPFVLTIPVVGMGNDAPIVDDVPIVLYAHGTGGSRNSPLGGDPDDEAFALAQQGYAVFSIDQVMHETRANVGNCTRTTDPSSANEFFEQCNVIPESLRLILPFADMIEPGTLDDTVQPLVNELADFTASGKLFYNPLNAFASRGNVIQSAVDYIWIATFIRDLQLVDVPFPTGEATLSFSETVDFMGHSQGSLFAPLLGYSSHIRGMYLSAGGGHLLSSLRNKTQPLDLRSLIDYAVCETGATIHHPVLQLFQTFMEGGDGVNYARHLSYDPATSPKIVFANEGMDDNYTPVPSAEALSTAARWRQIGPGWVSDYDSNDMMVTDEVTAGQQLLAVAEPGFAHDALFDGTYEFSGLDEQRHGAFKQYDGDNEGGVCRDDHFVSYCVPRNLQDWTGFFGGLRVGVPTVTSGE